VTALIVAMLIGTPIPSKTAEFPSLKVKEPLKSKVCDRACRQRKHMRRVVRPYRSKLIAMAGCESGGRWHIATGNGFYGGLQFTLSSWRAVGGSGYPHHASRLEQMYRAVKLSRIQGWGAWPHCQYA